MELEAALSEARERFEIGSTRSFSWRSEQLSGVLRLLREEEDGIFKALGEDLGKHRVEAFKDEVGMLIKSVEFQLTNLKKWMTPTKIHTPLIAFPTWSELVPEPLGVVLVISCWNFPIGLSLEPVIGALSAGNAVVLKPSELAPSSSAFLASTIPKYVDSKALKVIQGGPNIGAQLLNHKWDKIFFTGSARVGRIVLTAAAKHLTPVALELGGKCPAIVDTTLLSQRDKKVAVQRLVAGKWGACYGQACVAIDYLLVHEKFASNLVELIKETLKRFYRKPEHASRIINKHHFERLSNLLKDPAVASAIVHGGSMDHENLTIEPTILVDPPGDSAIMTEEIFGPLLPIITLKDINDSVGFIKARQKPLVIYAFTHNEKLKARIVQETSSGCVTINDALVQYACDTVPFGGIGESGIGKYHGKLSFDMFSHEKPVVRRNFLTEFSFRYPPWTERKMNILRSVYEYDYIGLMLFWLGLK